MGSRTRTLLGIAGIALVVFLIVLGLVLRGTTAAWDRAVLEVAGGAGTVVGFAAVVTELGSAWVLVPFVAAVALWAALRGRPTGALVLIAGALFTEALNSGLKWLVGRERPDWIAEVLPASKAFPSGHALVPTVIYGLAAFLVVSIAPRARTTLAVVVPLLCLAIGGSRIVLGVRWPTDVIGGFALAVCLAALGRIALDAAERSDRGREEGS